MPYDKSDKRSQRSFQALRLAVLAALLALSTALGLMHQFQKGTRPVGVDALCPFGAIEAAYTLITTGAAIERVAWSSYILLLATVLAALLFRRVFCGKICAFGTLQELFARLGRGIFRRRLVIPEAVDKPARYIKYAALAGVVAGTAITGQLFIRPYDPWATYQHLFSKELLTEFRVGLLVLAVSLVGSLFIDRLFCKYLCPMGAFLALIRRIGWFRVRRNAGTCIHCSACTKACPVNIPVETLEHVHSAECINCNLCVNVCPVKDTLYVGGPRKGSLPSAAVLGITAAVFTAVLAVGTASGEIRWTVKPLSERVMEMPGFNPDEIKGIDSFKAISDLTGIPEGEFIRTFTISEEDFEKPIRESAHRDGSGFDVEAVREFVRERLGK